MTECNSTRDSFIRSHSLHPSILSHSRLFRSEILNHLGRPNDPVNLQRSEKESALRPMGLLRASAAPLTGAALAGLLLYTCRESLSQRTHELTSSLHLSSRSLRRLAEVDDDGLRKSPFGKHVQRDLQESEEEILERIRSAYHAPAKPSLLEEVKSRWNVSLARGR